MLACHHHGVAPSLPPSLRLKREDRPLPPKLLCCHDLDLFHFYRIDVTCRTPRRRRRRIEAKPKRSEAQVGQKNTKKNMKKLVTTNQKMS